MVCLLTTAKVLSPDLVLYVTSTAVVSFLAEWRTLKATSVVLASEKLAVKSPSVKLAATAWDLRADLVTSKLAVAPTLYLPTEATAEAVTAFPSKTESLVNLSVTYSCLSL